MSPLYDAARVAACALLALQLAACGGTGDDAPADEPATAEEREHLPRPLPKLPLDGV